MTIPPNVDFQLKRLSCLKSTFRGFFELISAALHGLLLSYAVNNLNISSGITAVIYITPDITELISAVFALPEAFPEAP